MTYIAKCPVCQTSRKCATAAERDAWVRYHAAVWPSHTVETEDEDG